MKTDSIQFHVNSIYVFCDKICWYLKYISVMAVLKMVHAIVSSRQLVCESISWQRYFIKTHINVLDVSVPQHWESKVRGGITCKINWLFHINVCICNYYNSYKLKAWNLGISLSFYVTWTKKQQTWNENGCS